MVEFDELMKKAGERMNEARDAVMDLADKAGKKATELYGDAKVRLKISDIQKDINKLYREVGKSAYTANRSGEDVSAVINEKCDEIQRLFGEMEELSKSLSKEKENEEAEAAADEPIETEAVESDEPAEPEAPAEPEPADAPEEE